MPYVIELQWMFKLGTLLQNCKRKDHKKSITRIVIFFTSLILMVGIAHASFKKNLWSKWEVNNPLSQHVIPHDEWQEFLNRRIVTNEENINLVDYTHLSAEDYALLRRYIDRMSKIDVDNYNRKEQLAFWINLYNALTVQVIADYYPINSIAEINISPGLFSNGPWGKKLVIVDGSPLSLDEIQNRIIRPIWNDQRVLYALNNGSIGAANLNQKAYIAAELDSELDKAAYSYINSLRGVQVIEGTLVVSKIYDWFSEDFGGTEQNIINHIKQFAKKPLFNQLKQISKIDSYICNWHLNATAPREPLSP